MLLQLDAEVRIIDLVLKVCTFLHRELDISTGLLVSQHLLEVVVGTFALIFASGFGKPGAHYIILQLKNIVVLHFVYKTGMILWKKWSLPSKGIFIVARSAVPWQWYENTCSNKILQLGLNGSKVNCVVMMIGSTFHFPVMIVL